MNSIFVGELAGTAMLLLMGNGVVANVLLKDSKGNGGGWIVITAGWAFAVMLGVFTAQAFGSAGAWLNPATAIASAMDSGNWSNCYSAIMGEMIGGFLGAALVWVNYFPHFGATTDASAKLAIFCTAPAIRNTTANLVSEIIGTAVLVIGASAIFASTISDGLGPYLVGMLVWAIGLSLGGTTGYAINPARDLAPRIAHALLPIAGKGSSDWGYAWIPVAGSIIGAVVGRQIFGLLN